MPLGATPYCITWTDPDFDPSEPAAWYARVKEQPTWRWSHYDCEALRASNPSDWQTIAPECLPGGALDVMIQERAWTSSIWHLPGGPVPVRATTLKLRDGSERSDPSRGRLTFKSSTKKDPPANRIVPPARGSAGDPTAGGATLTLYNPESGETWTAALPAAGWSAKTAGTQYTFAGGSGPVQKLSVRADRITVKGRGSELGYSLDEPRQGTVAVRLQLGTASPWCAEAPAKTSGKPATSAKFDAVDGFTGARRTPPPDQCPLIAGSPSGAFLVS